jgi:hypothetical protein
MTNDNWHTLRVPPEAYEQAKAQKEDHDRTWGEQVVRPDGEDTADTQDLDAQEIAASIRRELGFDGDPENVADVDALAEAVADRIDTHSTVSLEASEYSNIADEIQGRLR